MRNLTDIHHQLSAADQVYLEKRAEQIKIAEEEDAAGRIMARGFADELSKLAGDPFDVGPKGGQFKGDTGGIIPSGGYQTGGGKTGPAGGGAVAKRPGASQQAAAQAGGGSQGGLKGAPPMGRMASKQPNATAPKPAGAAPKPMGGIAMNTPRPGGR